MDELNKLFQSINRKQFLIQQAETNPESGIQHHWNKNALSENELITIKKGLVRFISQAQEVVNNMPGEI